MHNSSIELQNGNICQTECYKQPGLQLYHEDCLETLRRLPDGSVDLFLQDLPYGVTSCSWDKIPNLELMWSEWNRAGKENAAFVFTATHPFAIDLINSNRKFFKYEMIWEKNSFTNFMQAKRMPMRNHENILIFYKKQPTFNPQLKKVHGRGKSYNPKSTQVYNIAGEASKKYNSKREPGLGMSGTVVFIPGEVETYNSSNGKQNRHPSQKPIDLMRYFIKMFTNDNDTVFDGYSGSGTTAAACLKEKRNFIGSEMNKEYFDRSVKRLEEIIMQPELF